MNKISCARIFAMSLCLLLGSVLTAIAQTAVQTNLSHDPTLTATAFGAVNAATCEGLAELKLPITTITTAQSVAPGAFTPPTGSATPYKELPAFCRVAGVIKPTSDSEIKFEIWMPSANWNGKFHGIGN
ncbi:MAG TPA: hypothetical protein VJ810_38925, partial [Blastocatellia bacterium]|nr:hypothetical protein [Blastocatellia bacterium]